MATVLTLIAWTIDLLLSVMTAVIASVFFLISPAFRRQSVEHWGRKYRAARRPLLLTTVFSPKRGA